MKSVVLASEKISKIDQKCTNRSLMIYIGELSGFGEISNGPSSKTTGPIPIIFGALEREYFSLSSEFGFVSIQQKPILPCISLLNV